MNDFDDTIDVVFEKVEDITKLTLMELFKRVIEKTPVQTGRAKGNWQATIDKASNVKLDVEDKSGKVTIDKVAETTDKFELGHKIFLSNNLSYVQKLEYGSSKQAPKGMVRTSIQELNSIFDQMAKD